MDAQFQQVDFGPLKQFLDNDDVTDISYSNGGQVWIKTLSKGVYRVENTGIDNALVEKIAFQCANTMGKSFNMANPFLDAESAELRLNFVHDSIARNGVALLVRKTPAKIRLVKDQIIADDYIRLDIHDFLIKCVEGHCNILVSGETGSGKTEFIKYLAAHTKENEKIITIEDTLELHLDKIFPTRDIVAMKTNNIASYSDVLVTCMRQNPRWILLSEVRSAEAVMAVRNSISSGHNILSTIHADKAASIPNRLYSLLESNIDLEQFLRSIHRYVQLGVHIKGYYSPERQKFHREISEVVEFYVTEDNEAKTNTLYKKTPDGKVTIHNPTKYLLGYLESQGLIMQPDILVKEEFKPVDDKENYVVDNSTMNQVIKKTNSVPINQVKPQPIINNQVNPVPNTTVNTNPIINNQARPQPVMNNPKPPVINQPVNNNSPNRFIQANNVAVNQQNNPINNQVPKPNGTNIVQNNQ
jgi:pilus assembly protein CpaF